MDLFYIWFIISLKSAPQVEKEKKNSMNDQITPKSRLSLFILINNGVITRSWPPVWVCSAII